MSDFSVSIVPRLSVFPHKEKKTHEIISWLINRDIIKPQLTNCILGPDDLGHAISQGAKEVVKDPKNLPFDLKSNGLEIIQQRHIFISWQYGLEKIICPNCQQNLVDEDWGFFEQWYEGSHNHLTCPRCGADSEVHSFQFSPSIGFSNLGFTFWNWNEFKPEFLEDFSRLLETKIDVVYARI